METINIIFGMLIGTLTSAIGLVQLKLGSKNFHLEFNFRGIINILKNFRVISGLILYLFATAIFIYFLRETELSFLYPLTSLTYIYVTILSYYILKERMNFYKLAGVLFIVFGLILISLNSI